MDAQKAEAVVIDVKLAFGPMVAFMIKSSLASIPAILLLFVVGGAAVGLVNGLLGTHWLVSN